MSFIIIHILCIIVTISMSPPSLYSMYIMYLCMFMNSYIVKGLHAHGARFQFGTKIQFSQIHFSQIHQNFNFSGKRTLIFVCKLGDKFQPQSIHYPQKLGWSVQRNTRIRICISENT